MIRGRFGALPAKSGPVDRLKVRMRCRTISAASAAFFLFVLALPESRARAVAAGSAEKPSRIVSLNLCTDELLLRLADRDRIASVTWLAQDPRAGNLAAIAATIPANHGAAEDVLAAHPDLVVAGAYTARTTIGILRQAGLRVVEFGVPRDLAEVYWQIGDFAAAIGEPARGDALIADMRARLDASTGTPTGAHPRTFVLSPNGFTAGRGSLVDDILAQAGLDNLAAGLDLGSYGQVPLETVVLEHADVLVIDAEQGGAPSLATDLLRHPVLTRLSRQLTLASVPSRLWTCAGPSVVEAIDLLRGYRADALRQAPR